MNPFPSAKELLVLKLLHTHPQTYALDLVRKSQGQVKMGTIYVLLASLLTKGMVVVSELPQEKGKAKPLYSLTPKGLRMCRESDKPAMSTG